MDRLSLAEERALDTRCRGLPASPASRSSVAKLRAMLPASQARCIGRYAQYDLPNLVRCALDAVCHCCAVSSASISLPAGSSTGHLG